MARVEFPADPDDSPRGGFDLAASLRMLRRWKWWILGSSLAAMIPALVYVLIQPDVFSATATVQVRGTPEVMDLGTDFMPGEIESRRRGRLGAITSIAQSDAVLGRVVDQMEAARSGGKLSEDAAEPINVKQLTPSAAQQRKARIEGLRARVIFSGESPILQITAYGSEPDEVTSIANLVADAIVTHEAERRQLASRRAMSWLNTQIYELRGQIDRQKQTVTELAARHGISPDQVAEESVGRTRFEQRMQTLRIELMTVRQRIAELSPGVDATGSATALGERARLREQYQAALTQLTNARLTYTSTHPEVLRLQGVVKSLQGQLGPDANPTASATDDEVNEYRRAKADEGRLLAESRLLEQSLQELGANDMGKSEAVIEYERRRRETGIDEQTLTDLLERRNKTLLGAATDYATEEILDYAIPPRGPSGPKRAKGVILSVLAALGFGLGIGFCRDMMDQAARDPEEAAELLRAPVLGLVPRIHDGTPPERQSDGPPSSLSAESYRNLRTALLFALGGSRLSSLLVTSATAGEGKTTVSANLAASFAQAGRHVLLVDADMRLPRGHKVFGMTPSPGLAELIRGDIALEDAIRRPSDGRFDILTAGKAPPNPSELLASPDFALVLARLKASYELVLIDSPVLLGVSDSYILGAQTEGTLLVHRPGSVPKRALEEIRIQLNRAGVNLVGVAFNQIDRADRHFYPLYMESPYVSKGKPVSKRVRKRTVKRLV